MSLVGRRENWETQFDSHHNTGMAYHKIVYEHVKLQIQGNLEAKSLENKIAAAPGMSWNSLLETQGKMENIHYTCCPKLN